ncbi:MAG: tRNA (adenosine(37)-N6)-threonylcarbamoyltransferase complex transferase subunit TsaD [bacterium]
MKILGIETSCDETGCSIVEDGKQILANVLFSQVCFHEKFGGVVPEIASRKHLEVINTLIDDVFEKAKIKFNEIDAIAVTQGPGLVGALLIGITTAKCFAWVLKKPLIGINHLEAHLFSIFLEQEIFFPFIGLIVSGGHTLLVYVKDFDTYEILATTVDDAAGEAYDKVAKLLELGYPGGHIVEKFAKIGNSDFVVFPQSKFKNKKLAFSFSGLKTAVSTYILKCKEKKISFKKEDVCASFQKSIINSLVKNTIESAYKYEVKNIVLSGGVACNKALQLEMTKAASLEKIKVFYPSNHLCTDNGAMIASLAYYKFKKNNSFLDFLDMNAFPDWELGD